MKSVKERVIEQVKAQHVDLGLDDFGAELMVIAMTNEDLLSHISAATDEMFKEQWDQTRNALIASSR